MYVEPYKILIIIIIIEYRVLRLVWRNHPSPLGSVPRQPVGPLLNASHPISQIIWSKFLISAFPFSSLPRYHPLSNPSCLRVCVCVPIIIWPLLFFRLFHKVLFSPIVPTTSSLFCNSIHPFDIHHSSVARRFESFQSYSLHFLNCPGFTPVHGYAPCICLQ